MLPVRFLHYLPQDLTKQNYSIAVSSLYPKGQPPPLYLHAQASQMGLNAPEGSPLLSHAHRSGVTFIDNVRHNLIRRISQ